MPYFLHISRLRAFSSRKVSASYQESSRRCSMTQAYRRLRDLDEEDKETLRGLLLEDRHERGVNYVRLLAYRNGWAADDAEELYETILSGPKKNKAKYRKALTERFGKEPGERYYLVTKSHYNYVKKI